MSGLGGGGGGTTTVVQQANNPLTPYITDIGNRAQELYGRGYYQGAFVPQLSPYTQQAWNLTAQRALAGSPATTAMQNQLTDTLNGRYLDPNTNPWLSGAVNNALGLAKSNYLGLYGGPAGSNVNNSGFQEGLTRTLGDVATNAYANAYQQGRQQQLQAASLVPSAVSQDYANLAALSGVGTAQEARGAQEIGGAQQQFYSPWTPLGMYSRAIGAMPSAGGTQSTMSPYFTNPLANALGLGMGALSLYNMGNQAGLWSGIGGLFGGGGGGMGIDAILAQGPLEALPFL